MKIKLLFLLICSLCQFSAVCQNRIDINAVFDIENNQIQINQSIEYKNTSKDTLKTIYLNDWSNSYSTKSTPLANRFSEEFNNNFHFAENEDRGFTVITALTNNNNTNLIFERLALQPDVVKVELENPLFPETSYILNLTYTLHIPKDKFTRYGVTSLQDYNLKYWYITPAIYNGSWQYYSNKNLDDLYIPKADINLQVEFPRNYLLTSELDLLNTVQHTNTQTVLLSGKDRIDSKLFLNKLPVYKTIQTDNFSLISNITEKDLEATDKAVITDKITSFISKYLGNYPHKKLIVSVIDTKKDPIYGLNQLPEFIRPFPIHFQYELILLKSTLNNFLDNTLLINPRKEQWLKDGIQIYFLIKYIEDYYPDMKLLGSLANVWGIRSFHAADLKFNEQYGLVYMHMARTNLDQPLTMHKDSLLKFNKNLANKYKAGVGLKYLDDYINEDILEVSIKSFLDKNRIKTTTAKDFEIFLKSQTTKNIDWFFEDFITTRKKIDFKIKNVKKTNDSITLTIKNKRENKMPVSLFTLNNDSIISKTWIDNVNGEKTLTIPRNNANKLVLNYDNTIPEFNLRDNWKSLKGFFFNNKPFQLRLIKDVEDPYYNQVFIMPLIEFRNIYDGLILGAKLHNKTLLRKGFNYRLSPQYGTKSKSLTGGATVFYLKYIEDKNLYNITYGLTGSYSSYAEDLFVKRITPFLTFNFRDNTNFRSNKFQALKFRFIDITRDEDINNISNNTEPNFKVFNARYINTNPGLINYYKWFTDFQLSKDFGKLSFNYEYRKLFESNRQLNIRFFAGTFLYNNNPTNSDFFSFALDRPTDYLFDYNYLGRSEASGIFSQQLIIAEGGFKSKLDTPFANQWISTFNLSTTLWKYVQAYGDIGLVKNKHQDANFVYDSGIRLNLVTDYFEIYFPIYSNLGWEIGNPNYDQKIRFLFTVDPEVLLGLFRRKWY
ncbi:MAG: metalloprotease [Flavobacteriaceae bacterium]|nr:metalloprotease [Flavobacteriaceae bacterium]